MTNCLIKVCGITNPEQALQAAIDGVDFIGIVFHQPSVRNVTRSNAIDISQAIQSGGALPVAVFVDQTASEMQAICEETDIHIVQLHGRRARAEHHLLPDDYQRLYVQSVSENGQLEEETGIKSLDRDRDFILIDHIHPGYGHQINHLNFSYPYSLRWFLAGGLTPENVISAIDSLQPNGVDVSSGVEASRGNKSSMLIQQFVKTVRGHHVI